MTAGWVSNWESLGQSLAKGASYDQIRRGLDGVAVGGADAFAAQVQLAFQAFALSSRALMLSTIEAAAQNSGASFEGFHGRIADGLAANAGEHLKLTDALWALSEVPVRGTKVPRPGLASRESDYRQSMLRLTRAMSSNTSAPALLTDRNTLQITAVRQGDGSFRIIESGK